MKQKWFGYINKNNEVFVGIYSYFDMHQLEQSDFYAKIIQPFEAENYDDAKEKAGLIRDKWLEEEMNKIKNI